MFSVSGNPLTEFISHYEPLRYDAPTFHAAHHRAKRSANNVLDLQFQAHNRYYHFNILMDSRVVYLYVGGAA